MSNSKVNNRAAVRVLYNALLNRDPDPQGWEFYSSILDSNKKTLHQLGRDFVASGEFIEKSRAADRELMSLGDYRVFTGYKAEDLLIFDEFSHAKPQPRAVF